MENIKKQIGIRINAALAAENKKQKELAAFLGVTDNTISYFVSGKRSPNMEQIIKIADYLNTTTDYLLGRNNVKTTDMTTQKICEHTGLSEEAIKSINMIKNLDDRACLYIADKIIATSSFFVPLMWHATAYANNKFLSHYIEAQYLTQICKELGINNVIDSDEIPKEMRPKFRMILETMMEDEEADIYKRLDPEYSLYRAQKYLKRLIEHVYSSNKKTLLGLVMEKMKKDEEGEMDSNGNNPTEG